MACPKCGSKVATMGMSTTTLMNVHQWRDKNGIVHISNPNRTTTHYTCQCGTSYTETR